MDTRLKKFLFRIILLSLILTVVGTAIFMTIAKNLYFKAFPFLIILYLVVSVSVHSILLRSLDKSPLRFNSSFMLSFMLKLFIYAIFVGIVLFLDKTNKYSFIIATLFMYIIYTVFDVKSILNEVKNKQLLKNKKDV